MLNFLRRFIYQFKEYILFVLLVIISLSLLASNDKPEVKRISTFALGNFAVVNSLLNYITDLFKSNPSYYQLKEENARLMLEINRLRKEGIENENLRTMLSIPDTIHYKLVAVDVVSKLVNRVQGNFILNKGLSDSIRVGMPVISSKGLVGLISDVTENFSVVKTLYNSSLNIAVTVQNINVDGVLSWNGHELIIKNIPTTYEINVGDKVETSDFSSLFPPNIPIGVISKKESLALGLLHTIFIEPYADIRSVSNLFILKVVPSKQINQLEMNLMK
ncbi:MAG: rod shape-determining protein MreC [Ignavibacteria bacterium]|nr:rod shape-determining protein MreC [Ignavibacteria bacterium]